MRLLARGADFGLGVLARRVGRGLRLQARGLAFTLQPPPLGLELELTGAARGRGGLRRRLVEFVLLRFALALNHLGGALNRFGGALRRFRRALVGRGGAVLRVDRALRRIVRLLLGLLRRLLVRMRRLLRLIRASRRVGRGPLGLGPRRRGFGDPVVGLGARGRGHVHLLLDFGTGGRRHTHGLFDLGAGGHDGRVLMLDFGAGGLERGTMLLGFGASGDHGSRGRAHPRVPLGARRGELGAHVLDLRGGIALGLDHGLLAGLGHPFVVLLFQRRELLIERPAELGLQIVERHQPLLSHVVRGRALGAGVAVTASGGAGEQ